MNAPLPQPIAAGAAAYEQAARLGNETSGQLARELRTHTRGEMLFSPADRGRYATDASIYQVMPVGVARCADHRARRRYQPVRADRWHGFGD